jgi:heme exporter protein B
MLYQLLIPLLLKIVLNEILFLLKKEITLEWRQKYAIGGILLYVASTIFIVYISFIRVQPNVWNVMFWIIALFASVNAVVKSFIQESGARQLYYYQLANPTAILMSKIIYNICLLLLINILTYGLFSFVTENPVKLPEQFWLALLLGSTGFGITFTFVSAISAKANNSATLMAILSFPIVLPTLLSLVKFTANALGLITDTATYKDVIILLSIDAILLSLAFILFPYIWRD